MSDKYSWNFYKYLEKYGMNQRILCDKSDEKPIHPMNIYVLQGTIGRSLMGIMESASKMILCFSMYPLDTYTDITESFWKTYVAKGRCMFDEDHDGWWLGDEHRYQRINRNSKRCRWCGAILRRNIVKTEITKRSDEWMVTA